MKIRTINLNEWNTNGVVRVLFYLGMFVTFLGSTTPWFFWPLGEKFVILSSFFFILSMGIANAHFWKKVVVEADNAPFYSRTSFAIPLFLYSFLIFYQAITLESNYNSYIVRVFSIITLYSILTVKLDEIREFCDFLAKILGAFLIVSIFFFLLYLLGFPLPYRNVELANLYSCSNYYFFLIDDREIFTIIPRFQSIFAEPGHLGTLSVMILFTQVGKWKRWYNIPFLIATFISFSLAAYGLIVAIIFLGLWSRGIQVFKKLFYAVVFLSAITASAFFYNNGDNLLHNLIMLRLEIEDGEMAGDNRVTDDFKADYENFIQSTDILTGRKRDLEEFGNSGYRVFIYDYGLIGLVLLIIFYVVTMYHPTHKKEFLSVLIIAAMNFIIRGNILQFFILISLYQVVNNSFVSKNTNAIPLLESNS